MCRKQFEMLLGTVEHFPVLCVERPVAAAALVIVAVISQFASQYICEVPHCRCTDCFDLSTSKHVYRDRTMFCVVIVPSPFPPPQMH